MRKKKRALFDWIHYAFSILEMMGFLSPSLSRRPLGSFNGKTNKKNWLLLNFKMISIKRVSKKRIYIKWKERSAARSCDDEWKWRKTILDYAGRSHESWEWAHFFLYGCGAKLKCEQFFSSLFISLFVFHRCHMQLAYVSESSYH